MQNRNVLDYTLLRPLGKGGMAEVWYAENDIEKPAAVKILNADLSLNESIVERFRNEARVMVKLNHPNIRQVYSYASLEERPCIVMEYLEGSDLNSRMKHGERFTDVQLKKWWNQLVSALNYTHAQGVVHRDIKPSNIFITADGNVKLLDFGIAKVRDSITSTATGAMMGTLMYMSPEQVRDSKHIDYKTDLYSLAVTFVHLLTGHAPYDRDTTDDYEIRKNIVETPLNLAGLPSEWQGFLRPYLAKSPADRPALREFGAVQAGYATPQPVGSEATVVGGATVAAACAADEGTVAARNPATQPRPHPYSQPQPQPRKRRVWPWVLAAFVVVAAVGVTIWLFNRPAPKEAQIIYNAVTDIDGNSYNAVQIGEQVWMAENMRAVHDRNGNEIAIHESGYRTPCRDYPYNNPKNVEKYGYLYSWEAAMRVCPEGWHLPTDAEWMQLEVAAGMSQADDMGWRGDIAAKLCSDEGWEPSSVTNAAGNKSASGRNATGFGALPADDNEHMFARRAYFWSATQVGSDGVLVRVLAYDKAEVCRDNYGKCAGLSVRCVRD